ncbi:FUSC family protein [Cellulomonas marina]|uniref:FUSC family protein n=1 Tax=Cellulomonas marina TaxID=988821 RepID=UPI001EF1D44F|nr:FUSC family protein [Cellulomonas marina]
MLQAAVAGGVSYAVGLYVLGHPAPFFAPVSAWVCLGFTRDRSVRRVSELAVGVAVGVALGDLVVHLIGTGAWQIAVTLFVAALVGRFLDRGVLFTTQAGVQAIVIVGLPVGTATGGPLGRWTDALAGGLVALAVAVLTPTDPRTHPRRHARDALLALADVLRVLARGLDHRDVDDVEDALVLGRTSQPALDGWQETAGSAHELARLSPAGRRHRDELRALAADAVLVDRAMRNTRVLARRSSATLTAEQVHDVGELADVVAQVGAAVGELAHDRASGRDPEGPRRTLHAAAERLDPYRLGAEDWQVQGLVLLARSLVVDLLEAAGEGPVEARAALPPL